MTYKILLVEDDLELASVLKDFLEDHKLEITLAEDGDKALQLYEKLCPHLVLLDIVLPKKNGFEVIEAIRKKDSYIPIILMTGTELGATSEVKGYQLGAVNYLRKPVLPMVVLALIQRLLDSPKIEYYTLGCYQVIIQGSLLQVDNNSFQLREKDTRLLSLLLKNQGRLISRQHLLQSIWQDDNYQKSPLLDSAVFRVRKVMQHFPGVTLQGIYGEGYILHFIKQ